MARLVAIPEDIIYKIIAAVGNDKHLLKQCAIVSSSFLVPSRKQLFSKIVLEDNRASQRLHQCLIQNPVIPSFVRSIHIAQYHGSSWVPPGNKTSECLLNSQSTLAILRLPFCYLESFSIYSSEPMDWSRFSSELKDALSNIIHSSTLKTLGLRKIDNVPIILFRGIVHLTELQLDCIYPTDFDGAQSSSLTAASLKGVASHTVIDQCTWSFWGIIRPTEPICLPFISRLRYCEIYASVDSATICDCGILSSLIRSLFVSLTSPATLEHLKVGIQLYECFDCDGLFEDLHVWRHLDSIITHPAGSRLQRVDIDIHCMFHYNVSVLPDSDEISETLRDALPLLRDKGILFVEVDIY